MPTRRSTFSFDLKVKVEKRGNEYFAATTIPFAITVYGKSRVDVDERVKQAVLLLLKQYSKSSSELSEYLNRRKVKHTISQNIPATQQIVECQEEMRVKVPA